MIRTWTSFGRIGDFWNSHLPPAATATAVVVEELKVW
jgi:hypothetical protein